MKNRSSLTYSGNVKITISKKSYKYKNSGNRNLFEILARWLSGEEVNQDASRPRYLKVQYEDSDGKVEDISFDPIFLYPKFNNNDLSAVFTGTIIDTNLNSTKIDQILTNDGFKLSLYNSDTTNGKLASIDLASKAVLEQIRSGRQALVEWKLNIENKGGNTKV